VRDLVGYVHLKNYAAATCQWTVFDQGDIDLPAQLQALRIEASAARRNRKVKNGQQWTRP
jgi:hypothetical protein